MGKLDFTSEDFAGLFMCSRIEQQVQDIVNASLARKTAPVFPEKIDCKCRLHKCVHTKEEIIKILERDGIWAEINAKLQGHVPSSR